MASVTATALRFWNTAYWPYTTYDEFWVYGYNAKIFMLRGAIPTSMGYYPQLLPLAYTFGQLMWGGINDHAARVACDDAHRDRMRLEKTGKVDRVEHGERIPVGLPGAREGGGVGQEIPGFPGDRRGQLVLVPDHRHRSAQIEQQSVIEGVHHVEGHIRFQLVPDLVDDMIRGKGGG